MATAAGGRSSYNHSIMWGIIVWWTAQAALGEPADRDNTDRAGSHVQDDIDVCGPSPPPTTINEFKASHAVSQLVTFTQSSWSDGICC